jgi:hypothetical protein
MSTSVTRGASSGSKRSNRMLGVASAALGVIIAVAFALAVDHDDPGIGVNPAHPAVPGAHQAKADLLAERAKQNYPGTNPEAHQIEINGSIAAGEYPGTNPEAHQMAITRQNPADYYPGTNPEANKMRVDVQQRSAGYPGINPEANRLDQSR